MINFAIVEDEDQEANALMDCMGRYERENDVSFAIDRYRDAVSFLENNKNYDVVFMDIMLPNMNGMEAAARMRKMDTTTVLIFVTNMAQFAVKSYEVDAFDYILKPVTYERVTFKLNKILNAMKANRSTSITVRSDGGYVRFDSSSIYYIEISGHKLIYVTDKGSYSENGTLKVLEEKLKEQQFMRCNSCYLVNPEHISSVKGLSVVMRNGDELKISQPKKKAFMNELTTYFGQIKC